MSRDTEQREQLEVFERQFKERLLTALQKSALSSVGTGLFHTSRSRVASGPVLNQDTVELETLGEEIKRLRNKLGEPIDTGAYGKYMEYCSKWDAAATAGKKYEEPELAKELLQILKA